MSRSVIKQLLLLALLVAVLVAVVNRPVAADDHARAVESTIMAWEPAAPGTQLSDLTAYSASAPVIEQGVSANDLVVVYNRRLNPGDPRDPYYTQSSDNGLTWTPPAPIYTSPGIESFNVDVAVTSNGTLHAVWAELDLGASNHIAYLLYSSKTGAGSWTTPTAIRTVTNTTAYVPIIASPRIHATGSGTLDLVWVEADQSDFSNPTTDIFHARSVNGGANWTNNLRVTPSIIFPTSFEPDVTVDNGGVVHVVWQESAGANRSNIHYVRSNGAPTGAVVTWANANAPLTLNLNDPTVTRARRPRIVALGNTLTVALTHFTQEPGSSETQQFAYVAQCSSNCLTLSSWSLFNASGQSLDVNSADPFDLATTLAHNDRTVFVYFHGLDPISAGTTERIWGSNQCEFWAQTGRDNPTPSNLRAIYPDVAASDSWLHAVYEWVDTGGSGEHRIYHMRAPYASCRTFLPLVKRN